jgi:hypothetical protein
VNVVGCLAEITASTLFTDLGCGIGRGAWMNCSQEKVVKADNNVMCFDSFVCHLASNLVDDDWNPAYSSILALACSSWVSAVAVSYLEIHQLDPISELLQEISCKHLPQIGELVVGHQDV